MQGIQLQSPTHLDNLRLAQFADPGAPGSGEIRVRIHASSLNFHDYLVAVGGLPTAAGRIPLSDGAGVVEAVGPGVDEFKVGDHVVSCFFPTWQHGEPPVAGFATTPGDGVDGYAREYAVRPAGWFTHAPAGYTHAEAATLTTAGLTAWRALVVNGGLKAGDSVLTMGTGGVSIFALQIAKMMGATVISTSSSDAKLERLKALGADHTINYQQTPDWGARVLELTDGRGVDHVVEVGGPATLAQSITAARIGGHIALIGVLTGIEGNAPILTLLAKQIRLHAFVVGSRNHQQEMVRALSANKLRPVIDRSFPLGGLADAFRHEESGRHFGKICIEI
ncbi:NAD(P)-dependent alcohol dehydrogenase [Dechloromonas sp. XY25]|uniref:NAD(P)-dependent alcohol dehydrogenase n=1 Tax=Dechloromonas hankyongensis TaxID=2908002 RepID=A0ABS9K238_9RHOO|nr:NAD(P)-dependent alcohol dehydrogenase [Dechloromonas hankyongensis]MCG2577252.1 NAD(P)-dependent alcohol dehydrogenase [Dechloromonas hankyongensis]